MGDPVGCFLFQPLYNQSYHDKLPLVEVRVALSYAQGWAKQKYVCYYDVLALNMLL